MAKTILALAALLTVVAQGGSPSTAQQPSVPKATQIVDSFITALGGEMSIRSIDTIQMTLEHDDVRIEAIYHEGQCMVESKHQPSNEILSRTIYDGKTWTMNGKELSDNEKLSAQTSHAFPHDAIRLRGLIDEHSSVDRVTDNNGTHYRISVEGNDGYTIRLTFDSKSKLLVSRSEFASNQEGPSSETVVAYSYREKDGVLHVDEMRIEIPDSDEAFRYRNVKLAIDEDVDQNALRFMEQHR